MAYKRTNIDPKITTNAHTTVILSNFIFGITITIISIYYYCGGGSGVGCG
jgi:hypothetical protein